MALLDIAAGVPAFEARTVAADRKLSGQERLVVLLSRTDPLWSLERRRAGSHLLSFLFGIEAPHRLADPRLEALRHYAVTYRERHANMAAAETSALESGFAESQLHQVRGLVDSARAVIERRTGASLVRQLLFGIAGLLIAYGAIEWIGPRLDSMLIGFVLVAVALLSAASLFRGSEARRLA